MGPLSFLASLFFGGIRQPISNRKPATWAKLPKREKSIEERMPKYCPDCGTVHASLRPNKVLKFFCGASFSLESFQWLEQCGVADLPHNKWFKTCHSIRKKASQILGLRLNDQIPYRVWIDGHGRWVFDDSGVTMEIVRKHRFIRFRNADTLRQARSVPAFRKDSNLHLSDACAWYEHVYVFSVDGKARDNESVRQRLIQRCKNDEARRRLLAKGE